MRITLRFDVPDTAVGRNAVRALVDSWLTGEDVTISTPDFAFDTQLTYVKENS